MLNCGTKHLDTFSSHIIENDTLSVMGGTGIIPGTESRVCYLGFDTGPGRFDLSEVPITMSIFSNYVFANYNVLLSHEFTSSKYRST